MLTIPEQQTLDRAYRLIEITKLDGWKDIISILSDNSQKMYPDPSDVKYRLWGHIEKDYTYARGGTEVVKEFINEVNQQGAVASNLQKKADKKRGTHRIGE